MESVIFILWGGATFLLGMYVAKVALYYDIQERLDDLEKYVREKRR